MQILIIDEISAISQPDVDALVRQGLRLIPTQAGGAASLSRAGLRLDAVLVSVSSSDPAAPGLVTSLRNSNPTTALLVAVRTADAYTQGAAGTNVSARFTVRLLDAGADDVMQTPLIAEVVAARIRAIVRRSNSAAVLNIADLSIDRLAHAITHGGKHLALTARQYALLDYLAIHADKPVSRAELLEHVWKLESDPGSNVVDVHIAQLRKRLRNAGSTLDIRTIRGAGYMLHTGAARGSITEHEATARGSGVTGSSGVTGNSGVTGVVDTAGSIAGGAVNRGSNTVVRDGTVAGGFAASKK